MSGSTRDILDAACALAASGRRGMLCAIVRARGSTPQSAGSLMLVDENAGLAGTVGGGCVEAEVRREAMALLSSGRSALHRFRLDGDYGWDDGLICGGTVEIAMAPLPPAAQLRGLVEGLDRGSAGELHLDVDVAGTPRRFTIFLEPRPRLLIAGAGHVGAALARLALGLEFDVTLFDDREDCLERGPAGARRVHGDIATSLAAAPIDGATSAVVVTRGHRHDEQALEALLDRGARYVGMIGSRRKVALIFNDLRERGASAESLAAVHAPIGLPIGSVTVEEIALSIAAQLVEVRRRGSAMPVRETTLAGTPSEARARP